MKIKKETNIENDLKNGIKFLQAGNLNKAEKYFKRILQEIPEHFEAYHYLGIIQKQKGNFKEALGLIQKAIALKPDHAIAHNNLGTVYEALKKYDEALLAYKKSVELNPKLEDAWVNLSSLYERAGKLKEAFEVCKKALEFFSCSYKLYKVCGDFYFRIRNFPKACHYYTKALECKPDFFDAMFNLAVAKRELKEYKEAINICQKILHYNPNVPEVYNLIGVIYYDQRDFEKAINYYQKAIQIKPDFPSAYNNLGVCYKNLGNFEKAKYHFEKAIKQQPNYADAFNNLGNLFKAQGKIKEALKCYKKATQANSQFLEAWLNLGRTLCEIGNVDEGLTILNEYYKKFPDNPKVLSTLGEIFVNIGKWDEGEKLLRKSIVRMPDLLEARVNLSRVLFLKGYMKEVIEEIHSLISSFGGSAVDYSNLGNALAVLGKRDEAIQCYKTSIKLDPNYIPVYRHLAMVYHFKEGDEFCENYFELEKKISLIENLNFKIEALFALFKFYEDLGDYEKAFSYLKQGCDLKRSTVQFNIEGVEKSAEILIQVFNKDFIKSMQGYGCPTKVPVFIVGMPRSGTTLVEQILASHPEVHGAGELPFMDEAIKGLRIGNVVVKPPDDGVYLDVPQGFFEVGWRYLQKVRPLNTEALRITDKMPGNFTKIGIIALSLPEAKIIHCKRDPMDTCFSCYRTLFSHGHEWTYNLEELGRFYKVYRRIMEHWEEVLPEQFIEVEYEKLVENFQEEAKKIVTYCDLEWHPNCANFWKTERTVATASMMQVRKPIYKTSIGRWKKYEKFLEPLIKILEPIL